MRIKHMYNETKIAKIKAILSKDPCYKDMQMYEIDVVHQHSNGHFKSHKIYEEDIIKHSKNIIDLIEEGDYVNGYKVLYVGNEEPCPSGKYVDIDCNKPTEENYFFENEIKSIVTKEMFASAEYRVETD